MDFLSFFCLVRADALHANVLSLFRLGRVTKLTEPKHKLLDNIRCVTESLSLLIVQQTRTAYILATYLIKPTVFRNLLNFQRENANSHIHAISFMELSTFEYFG